MSKARGLLPRRRAIKCPDRRADAGLCKMEGKQCHNFFAACRCGVNRRHLQAVLGAFYQSHMANLKYQTAKNRYSTQVFQISGALL